MTTNKNCRLFAKRMKFKSYFCQLWSIIGVKLVVETIKFICLRYMVPNSENLYHNFFLSEEEGHWHHVLLSIKQSWISEMKEFCPAPHFYRLILCSYTYSTTVSPLHKDKPHWRSLLHWYIYELVFKSHNSTWNWPTKINYCSLNLCT